MAWEIRHFEKMLYNQVELIPLYVKAYEMRADPLFRSVVEESIAMTEKYFGKAGLYFSASDADSDHKEGDYFIYTVGEVRGAIAKKTGLPQNLKPLWSYLKREILMGKYT